MSQIPNSFYVFALLVAVAFVVLSRTLHKKDKAEAVPDNIMTADAGRIGFVLGGGDGLGHGVFATGPAKLIVKSFKVE